MFMLGKLFHIGSVIAWIFHLLACMGGCIGCPIKSELTPSVDKPVKQQYHDAPIASKELNPGLYESFLTPSTCDMDNSTVQSVGSISSFSTSTQMHDTHGISDSNAHAEFINHGLLLWNQSRHKWIGNRKPRTSVVQREPKWSWNATYDSLLGSNKPFPNPVPLGEMVDFLVGIWEQEGMYD